MFFRRAIPLLKFRNIPKKFSNSSHHGHVDGPYAVKHHHPYPDEAYMFGRKPGTPLEGWEIITVSTYVICFLILVIGANTRDDESLKVPYFIQYFS